MIDLNIVPQNISKLRDKTDISILLSHILLILFNIHWDLDEFIRETNWIENTGANFQEVLNFYNKKKLNYYYPQNSNIEFPPYDLLLHNDIILIALYTGYRTHKDTFVSIVKNIDVENDKIDLIINPRTEEFPMGHVTLSAMENFSLIFVTNKGIENIHKFVKTESRN